MEGNSANNQTDKPSEIRFNSNEINQKPADQSMFVRVREKNKFTQFIEAAFKGTHKFITIGIIIAIIAAITIITLSLTVWRSSDNTAENMPEEVSLSEKLTAVSQEAYSLLYSDSETAYTDALAFLDTRISSAETTEYKIELQLLRCDFLGNNGGTQMAIDELLAMTEDEMTDKQKAHKFRSLIFAYKQLGDTDSAATYEDQLNNLPAAARETGA